MKFVFTILIFTVSTGYAGVAETKAKKEADAAIQVYVDKVKKDCGSTLKVDYKHELATKVEDSGRDNANKISVGGSICAEVVSVLAELCADADYKPEVAKVTKLECKPTDFKQKPYWKAKKAGATITVELHPFNSYYSDGREDIKKLF